MGKKTSILLASWIGLFVLIATIEAQNEQWLQYHSAREAHRIMPGMGSSRQEATTQKPQGVNMPRFKTQKPIFVRWSTPMVEDGGLWIALDRAHEQGKLDRLYIDSNADGHLDDEEVVEAYNTDRHYTFFGPAKVVFDTEEGPVTYHLNFRYFDYNERNQRLYIYSGGWYEGEVAVAGRKKYCVLIDHNANGTFNDKSLNADQCDRIRIGKKGSHDTVWVGNYIEIDDVYYGIEICRDGAFIKLARAEDLTFGTIRVPETITELTVGGENGLFMLEPKNGISRLLVGQYRIDHWQIDREDDKGRDWTLRGSYFRQRGDFEIANGSETSLKIGEPVTASLSVSQRSGNYEFSKVLRGSLGEYIRITSLGRDVGNLWKMKATNEDGTSEKLFAIPDQ
jgi:hypothetical protein